MGEERSALAPDGAGDALSGWPPVQLRGANLRDEGGLSGGDEGEQQVAALCAVREGNLHLREARVSIEADGGAGAPAVPAMRQAMGFDQLSGVRSETMSEGKEMLYRFSVRIPKELLMPLKIRAIREGMTVQGWIAEAIKARLESPLPAAQEGKEQAQ